MTTACPLPDSATNARPLNHVTVPFICSPATARRRAGL